MLRFQKLQATGNDFIILDQPPHTLTEDQRQLLCDRHFGIGADGLLWIEPIRVIHSHQTGIFRMYYWNADGREGTFCGNGARVAFWLAHKRWNVSHGILLAADGAHEAYIVAKNPQLVAVQLHLQRLPYQLSQDRWFVHTGSPHLLIQTSHEELRSLPISEIAPPLRQDKSLDPGGVNVSFFASDGNGGWYLRTYERGVEAETLSCGTACVALAAVLSQSQAHIYTRGGKLTVRGGAHGAFWLIGSVGFCFQGEYGAPDSI
ncbi:MAG: diaminopimelate epimerase [Bacteroidia bacterium]|nr:diaminopimelate epimerase [Bacteroidia bacterium]MCX7652017.1 diaminopimelate epimerase [Bacteroidia bacterium]MDW8416312.1 diaminopimelate epimerase [Bacteroidia bacterium]